MNIHELIALERWVLIAGFGTCVGFGYVVHQSRFCTMGALSDWFNLGDTSRLRMWAVALAVAILGFHGLSIGHWIDPSATIYASGPVLWASNLLGGALFGVGMVLASGCGSKTLVRVGGGSLKALVVMLVMGLAALATMRGITGVLRVNTVDTWAYEPAHGNTLSVWVEALTGWSSTTAMGLCALLAAGVLLWWAYRGEGFGHREHTLGGLGVGLSVCAMWWVSGHLGFVAEHPNTLEPTYLLTNSARMESLSFTAPLALHLDWLTYFSDQSNVLGLAVVAVWGVILGGWLGARLSGTFRWEGFRDAQDTALHLLGAVLMGVGGVTAMGCTVGQGLSGLSTLSASSALAVLGIAAGAWLGFKIQLAVLDRFG